MSSLSSPLRFPVESFEGRVGKDGLSSGDLSKDGALGYHRGGLHSEDSDPPMSPAGATQPDSVRAEREDSRLALLFGGADDLHLDCILPHDVPEGDQAQQEAGKFLLLPEVEDTYIHKGLDQ